MGFGCVMMMCGEVTKATVVVFHTAVLLLQGWESKDLVYKKLVGEELVLFIK